MARVRQSGTKPETELRRELYRLGLRYRVAYPVIARPRRVADVAFLGQKLAVFVDGCFWHGCPLHASWPKHNASFWKNKIEVNRMRDVDTNARLRALGWRVVRIWGHESPVSAARKVFRIIRGVQPLVLVTNTRADKGFGGESQ